MTTCKTWTVQSGRIGTTLTGSSRVEVVFRERSHQPFSKVGGSESSWGNQPTLTPGLHLTVHRIPEHSTRRGVGTWGSPVFRTGTGIQRRRRVPRLSLRRRSWTARSQTSSQRATQSGRRSAALPMRRRSAAAGRQ
jgi:hypothetical protein